MKFLNFSELLGIFLNFQKIFSRIKETRNEGGYLYETDLSIAFCGTFEQRENIALNKIRRIVDQIKRLAKEEQRSKFEADQKRALSNEIQCYYFPSYSNVEQVKVPVF